MTKSLLNGMLLVLILITLILLVIAPSPNGQRNILKNQALQGGIFLGSQSKIVFQTLQGDRTCCIDFYHNSHSHLAHQYKEYEG